MSEELGRLFDPGALDDAPGDRVRIRIAVPSAWAREGASVVVQAPARLPCARCDGGGCDACGRSGAFRLDPEADARTFVLALPRELERPVLVRVAQPFGEGSPIALAFCEVHPSGAPSGCTRVEEGASRPRPPPIRLAIASVLLAAAGAIAWLLATR